MNDILEVRIANYFGIVRPAAQHGVQPTWGTHRVILAFCVAWSFSRFDRESTLPPQAANASRWALDENQKLR